LTCYTKEKHDVNIPNDRRYTNEHEWAQIEGGKVRVGITEYAQHELGDVVFADLPSIGAQVTKGASLGTVESVKAVSDIYAPIDGKVVAINPELGANPQLLNESPYERGWFAEIEPSNKTQIETLLDAAAYSELVGSISR
jgi:glycine cleavage system H protein